VTGWCEALKLAHDEAALVVCLKTIGGEASADVEVTQIIHLGNGQKKQQGGEERPSKHIIPGKLNESNVVMVLFTLNSRAFCSRSSMYTSTLKNKRKR
jgi:hypothetical protein